MSVSRRGFIAGAALALPFLARPGFAQASSAKALMQNANLGGEIGYAVADLRRGIILEAENGARGMAPASTMKALTTAYAFANIGQDFRFTTRLVATGKISGAVLRGDLILMGGADPTLTTDGLASLAQKLSALGVRKIAGRFLVYGGALPYRDEIAQGQPVQVGYNPAVSGMILNSNRVHFEWKGGQGGLQLGMDARTDRLQPKVYSVKADLSERATPVFDYSRAGNVERWSVARGALGKAGSRWLPVRLPDVYAGDVFQTLARTQGVELPSPEPMRAPPRGEVIAQISSAPLREITRDMLLHSTNITAEAVGLTTSAKIGVAGDAAGSGRAMAEWLARTAGVQNARIADHSGLGESSRIAPLDMVRALAKHGAPLNLRGVMRDFAMRDARGAVVKGHPLEVQAKTGTLNFVSTLAGYMTAPKGTELVFAIFTGDLARRARAARDEEPAGGGAWVRRSKILQSQLIERWAALYG